MHPPRIPRLAFACLILLPGLPDRVLAEEGQAEPPLRAGASFAAKDTLEVGEEKDADAAACLAGLRWTPASFTVQIEAAQADRGEWLARFPSPRPLGDATNDLVALEWYVARDEAGQPRTAPAAVIVHESGRGMVAGRIIARGLREAGLHTFLIHLPGYGVRTGAQARDPRQLLPALRQGVADVRRARDAVAALPLVDRSRISLQGTSLGGFVAATVAGMDQGYDAVVIFLAGGQVADVILRGERDAAAMRRRLEEAGLTEADIRELARAVEPLRLAHRVDPRRTWLYSGELDEVVPPASARAFAEAARLEGDHHVKLPVGHYTAALLLPSLLPKVGQVMLGR